MIPAVVIETGTLSHLPDVVALEKACFGADQFSKRQLAYLMTKAHGAFLVACYEARAVGYVSLVCRANSTSLRIYSIAVDPAFQGQHVGQFLLNRALQFAHEKQLQQISLEVNVNNAPAISFYQKNGFQTVGLIPAYYHDGSAAYRMRLDV
ncbi:MAG TPA: ribosomal protein S18-alanine N-acetyltransferase [Paludibacteraceae bacterium]|nr:ribosomal protein S18-alanine N-acetyltransferase [Paludibacteraceae bacterium]